MTVMVIVLTLDFRLYTLFADPLLISSSYFKRSPNRFSPDYGKTVIDFTIKRTHYHLPSPPLTSSASNGESSQRKGNDKDVKGRRGVEPVCGPLSNGGLGSGGDCMLKLKYQYSSPPIIFLTSPDLAGNYDFSLTQSIDNNNDNNNNDNDEYYSNKNNTFIDTTQTEGTKSNAAIHEEVAYELYIKKESRTSAYLILLGIPFLVMALYMMPVSWFTEPCWPRSSQNTNCFRKCRECFVLDTSRTSSSTDYPGNNYGAIPSSSDHGKQSIELISSEDTSLQAPVLGSGETVINAGMASQSGSVLIPVANVISTDDKHTTPSAPPALRDSERL